MSAGITRRQAICGLLQEKGFVDVSQLSVQMGVNAITIRRDLDFLENAGFLRRKHGGAYVHSSSVGAELDYSVRQNIRTESKRWIAKQVAALIENGDTVFLDAGTTTSLVAEELVNRLSITVITHSLEAADILKSAKGIDLYVIGGHYLPLSRSMVGPPAEMAIRGYRFRKMILATAGIDFKDKALTLSAIEEVPIKRAVIEQSNQVILVADQSKFDKPALISMISLVDVHTIVTDMPPPKDAMAILESLNINLMIASHLG